MNPEIRIQFSWLVYNGISKPLHRSEGGGKELISKAQAEETTESYRQAWKPHERVIINGMTSVMGLEFYKTVLDVYIAPVVPVFSTPTLISTKFDPDRFIDILTHELIHVLLSDNTSYNSAAYDAATSALWPFDDVILQNHIIVHAVLQHVFIDILKEEYRLERDIRNSQKSLAYAKAWEIVQEQGYMKIIADFKQRMDLE